ncbi:hypothetical protein Q7Q91_03085 [Lactiplantibacillus pentosus]|uniref:hypothetical protein n=1 Tax=Lactiplantibacillus pentosus TaxID=1589 RepID=UPI0026FA0359|nr:hypothetical protein [Lactiplantibacillus pentosus]MDO7803971.1 hypothetical protein [Lactiplantibacillus pentosus]
MNMKRHFELYNNGKRWLAAGVTVTSICFALNINAKADQSELSLSTSAVDNTQVNAINSASGDSTASSPTSLAIAGTDSQSGAFSPASSRIKEAASTLKISEHSQIPINATIPAEALSGTASAMSASYISKKQTNVHINTDSSINTISSQENLDNSIHKDNTTNVSSTYAPTSASQNTSTVDVHETVSDSDNIFKTPDSASVKVLIDNVPNIARYTNASISNLYGYQNGFRYSLPQSLAANTSWIINKIGESDGDTWYDLGNNQWVQGTGMKFLLSPQLTNSQLYKPITPSYNISSIPTIRLSKPFLFTPSNHQSYEIWNSYLDNRRDSYKTYVGKSKLVSVIAISKENVTWLNINKNQWIRLSGFDYEDLETFNGLKPFCAKMNLTNKELPKANYLIRNALTGMNKSLKDANNGMKIMESGIKMLNQNLSGTINALHTANSGMTEMKSGIKILDQNLSGAINALHTANSGMTEMESGVNIANTAVRGMIAANNNANKAITGMLAALYGNNGVIQLFNDSARIARNTGLQLEKIVNSFNWNTLDHIPTIKGFSIGNLKSYLDLRHLFSDSADDTETKHKVSHSSSFLNNVTHDFEQHSNQLVGYVISSNVTKEILNTMNTVNSVRNVLFDVWRGTVKIVGGSALAVTGVLGVSSGYAVVSLSSGGTAVVALPAVLAADVVAMEAGEAILSNGIQNIQQGLRTEQFHNGDRPESRTYGQISGKYNGKNVTYRVDAEPQGHKVQVQINGDDSFDERLDYSDINSVQDAIRALRKQTRNQFTSGNLQKIGKAIYKAAQSLK